MSTTAPALSLTARAHNKEISMARTANIQGIIDSFLARIGTQVAQGIANGIAKSGLLGQIRSAGAAVSKTKGRPGRKLKEGKTCSEKGCTLPARAKGMCSKHYQQKRYADLHGSAKPAKAAKRGRPPKAAKNVAAKGKAPKRIMPKKKASKKTAPKKMAPKKMASKKQKLAHVTETQAPALETKD